MYLTEHDGLIFIVFETKILAGANIKYFTNEHVLMKQNKLVKLVEIKCKSHLDGVEICYFRKGNKQLKKTSFKLKFCIPLTTTNNY